MRPTPTGGCATVDAELAHWHTSEDPGRYRSTATTDLALSLGVPEHTPVFVYDRLLTHDSTPTPTLADGAGTPRRMIHRLYLPVTTCTDVPALTQDPFRTPDELYTLLVQAGRAAAVGRARPGHHPHPRGHHHPGASPPDYPS